MILLWSSQGSAILPLKQHEIPASCSYGTTFKTQIIDHIKHNFAHYFFFFFFHIEIESILFNQSEESWQKPNNSGLSNKALIHNSIFITDVQCVLNLNIYSQ